MRSAKNFIVMTAIMVAVLYALSQTKIGLSAPIPLMLLIAEILTDTTTTYLCLKKSGTETNPIVGFLFKKLGIVWTFVIVWAVWVWTVNANFLHTNMLTQTAFVIVYAFVPVNNLVVLWRLSKK